MINIKPIKLVTDSTAYLAESFIKEQDIDVVPLSVQFEGETKPEGFPGQFEAFFRRLSRSAGFPKTSQPPVEAFTSVFEKALSAGREVLAVVLSSGVSGTYQAASIAAEMVDKNRISVVDSNTGCSAVHFLIDNAITRAREGWSRLDIVESLKRDIGRIQFYCTCTSLEYLKRSGRISSLSNFMGSVLNIKPIIQIDHAMKAIGKTRGFNKALDNIISRIPETVKRINVSHIISPQIAAPLIDKLKAMFPGSKVEMDEMGPVVGSHLGPGSIGICFEDAESR